MACSAEDHIVTLPQDAVRGGVSVGTGSGFQDQTAVTLTVIEDNAVAATAAAAVAATTATASSARAAPVLPPSAAHKCSCGRSTIVSRHAKGPYAFGWVCNGCRIGGTGERWFCAPCQNDWCLNCKPKNVPGAGPKTDDGRQMLLSNYSEGEYRHGWICNRCRRSGTGERWMEIETTSDLCFDCVPRTPASAAPPSPPAVAPAPSAVSVAGGFAYLYTVLAKKQAAIELGLTRAPIPGSVILSGATGARAHMINGTFEPVEGETCNGMPVYRNKDSPDYW